MGGCSGDCGKRAFPQEVTPGPWHAPPPGVVEYLVRDDDIVSTLRLINSDWRKGVNGAVSRIALSGSVSIADIENWVVALLTQFPRMDTIDCRGIGIIGPLADNFPGKVVHLRTHGCGSHEWEMLARFAKLETLVLCQGCSHNDLSHLSTTTTLRELEFRFIRHEFKNTDALSCLTNLQKLAFLDCHVETLQFVEQLTGLVELRINSCWKESLDYGVTSTLTNLTSLDLCSTKFGDGDASCLSCLVNLRKLELDHTKIGDAGFCYVSNLTKLSHLSIDRIELTKTGLGLIACMRDLEYVRIGCRAMTFENGLIFVRLAELRVLHLTGPVQNDLVKSIAALKCLTTLRLNVPHVTNDAFGHLSNLIHLKTLRIDNSRKPHEAGDMLDWGSIPQVGHLELWGNGWVDESLVKLSRMDKLEKLVIGSDSITDNGMQHLTKLEKLNYLTCFCEGVSKACEENFKERFAIFETLGM